MFDKVGQVAERMATNVSRRAFIGGLGKGALAVAGAMGAMIAFPGLVQARGCSCSNGVYICLYACANGSQFTTGANGTNKTCCKAQYKGCALYAAGCGSV
jgi:hypothetical protein